MNSTTRPGMNAPDRYAVRAAPLRHQATLLADALQDRFETGQAVCPRTLWWGIEDSGFSEQLLPRAAASATIADTRHRALRQLPVVREQRARALRLLRLHDLREDAEGVEALLQRGGIHDLDTYLMFSEQRDDLRHRQPAAEDGTFDRLVLDLTVNRVAPGLQPLLLAEAHRVMAVDGRLLATVLVADEPLDGPHAIQGLQAGHRLHLPTEQAALGLFEAAGFHGLQLHFAAIADPGAVDRIGDVEVRLCVVEAFKGKAGPCLELGQAVMYRGPWREVHDDDGHRYRRGQRVAVCAKTYALLMRSPYMGDLVGLRSVNEPPLDAASPFDCNTPADRPVRVTKGLVPFDGSRPPSDTCAPGSGCC